MSEIDLDRRVYQIFTICGQAIVRLVDAIVGNHAPAPGSTGMDSDDRMDRVITGWQRKVDERLTEHNRLDSVVKRASDRAPIRP